MAMKKNNRDYIAQMNKGMKQKLSMLLIACLLFTGYHGLTISGRAEQEEKEQTNEISVSGTQVKIQLLGEDIRRAAKEAIEKGDRVEGAALQGYSGDEDLQKEYAEIFSSEKEVYEIPLDSISEGLSESLAEEEAGLQVFVERDAKDLERLVRKESKESLLLYDKNSQLTQLFPKNNQEETKATVEKEEESGAEEALASDSNIEKTERNMELTGSELITFLYKNKADHRISFQLSVDGNTYPKVVVSPKTQLFKSFLDKLKKEEKKPQAETTVVASTEAKESTVAESTETEATASAEETEESESESAASSVSLVSTEGSSEETTVLESTVVETAEAESAEESAETKEHTTEVTEETEATEETVAERKATETVKEKKENFTGFLQEVISHYEEFLGELETARFAQYSLNELGRKTQNVEIKDFATVEVFYDDEAFTDADGKVEEVVLEAKRLVKPEEEGEKEGEKLTDEQVEAMKEHSIYEGSDALDIRFVSKNDRTKEIEPKVPVSVRLTFDKKAVPEEATADTIAIHHIVEDKDSGKVKYVETVLRSEIEKKNEKEELKLSEGSKEKDLSEKTASEEFKKTEAEKEETFSNEEEKNKDKENITKEFTVNSFSAYIVRWTRSDWKVNEIRFHYVDRNFREIAPTIYALRDDGRSEQLYYYWKDVKDKVYKSLAYKAFPNYDLQWVGYQNGPIYSALPELKDGEYVYYITSNGFKTAKGETTVAEYNFDYTACVHDFYFIYRLNYCNAKTPNNREITPDLLNEKYITDKQDGTYELTLTGQVKPQTQKQKLDIAFVYDNTAVMATDFNFSGKANKLGTEDYATNPDDAKSSKVKSELKAFMKKLSSNPDYDVRYALVTMDGDKSFGNIDENAKAKYDQNYLNTQNYQNISHMKGGPEGDINLVGDYRGDKNGALQFLENSTDDAGKSHGFNVTDTPYNDTKHLYGFTDQPNQIVNQLDALNEKAITSNRVSGENYESAIRNIKVLLGQSGNYQVAAGGLVNQNSKARADAQKIVIFIAGGNPKLSYIVADGVYEDTHRFNDSDYYMIRRNYSKGWSFGNGYSIDFAALNRARGEIHSLTAADAFYSIGVGKKENWNYLNDFAMGQYYDEDGNHRTHENYNETKHPDRREKALVDNIRYKCFDASQESGLSSALQQIYEREAGNQVKNIVIRDVLTKNVQPIMKDGTPDVSGQLVKMKPNGNKQAVEVVKVLDADEMKDLGLNGFKIEAKEVNAGETGISGLSNTEKRWLLTLKTVPEDFALPTGYDIRMIAKIEATDYAKMNSNFADNGMDRTDLNDIYKTYLKKAYHEDGKPDSMFNSSAHKVGAFTNEEADITYKTRKPNGSEETPPSKKYNKPIISLGNLLFEKTFEGIEEKDFFKASTGFTELGKKVLKQINFKVYRDLNGVEEPLLTINLGDDEIIKQLGKGPFKYHGYILEFTKGTGSKVSLTMKGMPLYRNYRVEEEVLEPEKELRESQTAAIGYKFDKKLHDQSSTETTHLIVKGMNYHFKNKYVPVQPQEKTILIKKVVNEFGGTAFSSQARGDVFDFYMALYNGTEAYDSTKTSTFFNNLSSEIKDKTQGTTKIKVKEQDGSIKEQWVIHFHLQHDTSLSLPMDPNVNFRLFELKKDEYEKANIDGEWNGQKKDFTMPTLMEIDTATKYSYTDILSNMGQTITFKNPRITVVPTGLRGDLTPYLFSIFGFTLMAGAYFAINKKKRREI